MFLESVDLPLAVSAMLVEFTIFAGGEVIAQAVEALGDTNMTGSFLAGIAEFLVVLVVVAFAALGASKDV